MKPRTSKRGDFAMLRHASSRSISGTVRPNRAANDALRGGRKHLTETEIEKLVTAARKHNRHGARDALAITLAFRHGLRSQEVCDLEWTQVDLQRGTLLVNRIKGGTSSTHYLNGTEMRALRSLRRDNDKSRFLFVSERGDVVTTRWFRNMVAKTGVLAGMPFPIHPHMLRHACGFKFANEGKDTRSPQGYLGHRNIQSTTVYTALAADRFKGWEAE